MPFIAHINSLNHLLVNPQEQFAIPAYQRRYSWQQKHLSELFEDIVGLDQNEEHLFGTVIFHNVANNINGLAQFEVVDGQQRLTTLTILLKSLQKAFNSRNLLFQKDQINRILFLYNDQQQIVNKLKLGTLDSGDYELIMGDEGNNYHQIQNQNLHNAIEYFDNRLNNYTVAELNAFYEKVKASAVVLRLEINDASSAYKLYEGINNRGLGLSATDIIKNFIFEQADHSDRVALIENVNHISILDQVKNRWTLIIQNLDCIDGVEPDDFFRQYLGGILRRAVTEKQITYEFKVHFTDLIEEGVAIVDFLDQIKNASDVYRKIHKQQFQDAAINAELSNLARIQCTPANIFLIHFLGNNTYQTATKIEILKIIEALMLRRSICKRQTGENNAMFCELARALDAALDANMVQSFQTILNNRDSAYPSDEEFELNFNNFKFGVNDDKTKYILEKIETSLRIANGLQAVALNNFNVERVIPKNLNTGNWATYLQNQDQDLHKTYVDKIGNLSLFTNQLNIIHNDAFSSKLTPFSHANQPLITIEITYQNNFTYQQITDRTAQFAYMSLGIWCIN
jgi:hypothetical protein